MQCERKSIVHQDDERRQLWSVYENDYAGSLAMCIQDQCCYDKRTFNEALSEPRISKFVLKEDGIVTGFAFITNDLDLARVAYVNPDRLRAEHLDEATRGEIWYVTALVVSTDRRAAGRSAEVIGEVAKFLDGRECVLGLDFSRDKDPKLNEYAVHQFSKARSRHGLSYAEPSFTELGGQTYGTIAFKKK